MGASAQSWAWQFMHVLVGGIPAKEDCSTEVWQYRQSIPASATWCLWLNGTGCCTATPTPDTYGERTNAPTAQPMPARMKTAPKMLTLARTLVLRWKI